MVSQLDLPNEETVKGIVELSYAMGRASSSREILEMMKTAKS